MNITLIERVIGTLDTITVCGAQNLDKMLGCINALRNVAQAEKDREKEQAKQAEQPELIEPDGIETKEG